MASDIGCVVVTYNRLDKLKKALASYDSQTSLPQYVMVIDNASSDGTEAFLAQWQAEEAPYRKMVHRLATNSGGSGGFYEGQRLALQEDANWILLSDDDAYLPGNYIDTIQHYIATHKTDDISAICGTVTENGTLANMHRRLYSRMPAIRWDRLPSPEEYTREEFEIDLVSFVGPVIAKDKLRKAGLAEKDYFIWYDDTENSMRLRKEGRIVCLTGISIIHDIPPAQNDAVSFKRYYGARNKLLMLRNHLPGRFIEYVFLEVLFAFYVGLCKGRLKEIPIRLAGIADGILGRKGLHPVYKPGWKA